jgi:hypothetical protein
VAEALSNAVYLVIMRQKIILVISLVFSFFLVAYSLAATATPDPAAMEKMTNDFLNNICANHGGVNCSVINNDASVTCNDGTTDNSLISVYAIPQCQATLQKISQEQSDFMAQSGCFPPSELRCINTQSYNNLAKHLSAQGTANSELGKNELNQCLQQIADYAKDLKNYKQCLINHGQPNFELKGKAILPVLKAIFCPVFYGNKSSYDQGLDLCTCERGYFLNNETCVQAGQICLQKHGANYVSKNGNCVAVTTQVKTTPAISRVPVPSKIILPTPVPKGEQLMPAVTAEPQEDIIYEAPPIQEPKPNIIQRLFSSFISGIKKMLRFI